MPIRFSKDANEGSYYTTYYCYGDHCPARTKKEPWPRSDYEMKYITIISKKGNPYRRKCACCKHCGNKMTETYHANDFA